MRKKSITALISTFSRAYHSIQYSEKIFDDYLAKDILNKDEYDEISKSMTLGINFFNPTFEGSNSEALRWIVDNQLSPTPLGRAMFTEKALENAVRIGAKQYLIFAAGYDTFAYRQPSWSSETQIFEIDKSEVVFDKKERIQSVVTKTPSNLQFISADLTTDDWQHGLISNLKFDSSEISFCSLLGLCYYLEKDDFIKLIDQISRLLPQGSSIIFDYPDEKTYTSEAGERTKKQVALASAANEKMFASYSYFELEKLLSKSNFLVYEHLTPYEITERYFKKYNQLNPEYPINAFDNVNYCLAVKK